MPTLTVAYTGIIDGLDRLRAAGWRTVVLTNGRRDNQEAKLRNTGIADLVDGWLISESYGCRKPDRRIFDAGLQLLRCPAPTACWMVGDDPLADIAPAIGMGMHTVWITHDREWPNELPTPTKTAATPAAGLTLLKGVIGG